MAYVPDEAIYASAEISGQAFKLYVCYYSHRNQQSGKCCPSLQTIHEETGINYTYISDLRAELRQAGWIKTNGKRDVVLVKGYSDIPKIANSDNPKIRARSSEKPNSSSSDIPNIRVQSSDIPNIASSEKPKIEQASSEKPKIASSEKPNQSSENPNSSSENPNSSSENPKNIKGNIEPVKEPVKEPQNPMSARADGRERWATPYYREFDAKFQGMYGMPYRESGWENKGDFKQLSTLVKSQNGKLTEQNWAVACRNFFASPMDRHTIRGLASNYPKFFKSAVDRYKVPISEKGSEDGRNQTRGRSQPETGRGRAPGSEDGSTSGTSTGQQFKGKRVIGGKA